jgi:hypothetical protein
LTDKESGGIWLPGIFATILGLVSPADMAALATALGMFYSVAKQLGVDTLTGTLLAIQEQLSTQMTQILDEANTIYAPIAQDWGKLQQFESLLSQISTDLSDDQIGFAADNYETMIYQAVIPSTMAVISFAQGEFGSCGESGQGLGYTPNQYGTEGYNKNLCNRFKQIGVKLSDVLNRTGGWSSLPQWECVSTERGTMCSKYH